MSKNYVYYRRQYLKYGEKFRSKYKEKRKIKDAKRGKIMRKKIAEGLKCIEQDEKARKLFEIMLYGKIET